ncbi:MAG: hypothetical protein WA830_06555, partial [Candidatus Sulfotelmatobacter sp.]
MKAVVAVSVAVSTLAALGQEAGGTKRALPTTTGEATPQAGYVFVPESSKEQPAGRVHTTYVLRSADGNKPVGLNAPMALSTIAPLTTTQEAETPQSLGCLYVTSPSSAGCIP